MDEIISLLSRKPYYFAVSVYAGVAGILSFVINTTSTGALAPISLFFTAICLTVAAWSGWYLLHTETDTTIQGLPLTRKAFYILLAIVIIVSSVASFRINGSSTGGLSIISGLWGIYSLVLAGLSWTNFHTLVIPDIADAASSVTKTAQKWTETH